MHFFPFPFLYSHMVVDVEKRQSLTGMKAAPSLGPLLCPPPECFTNRLVRAQRRQEAADVRQVHFAAQVKQRSVEIRLKRVDASADTNDFLTAEATAVKMADQLKVINSCKVDMVSRKQLDELREIERVPDVVLTQESRPQLQFDSMRIYLDFEVRLRKFATFSAAPEICFVA
jgi:hypothetical protein